MPVVQSIICDGLICNGGIKNYLNNLYIEISHFQPYQMKMLERKDWDLWSVMIGSLLLIGAVLALPDSLITVIVGIPFILFFPGYAILSVVFPSAKHLATVERMVISLGLSIAIAPVVGIGLNLFEIGAGMSLILLIIALVSLVFVLVGLFVRNRTEGAYLPVSPSRAWSWATSSLGQKGRGKKIVSGVMVVAIIASATALVVLVAYPPQSESFTEFYILGPDGKSADYPHKLLTGQSASVQVGIVNHEHRQVNYSLEIWLSGVTIVNNQTSVQSMYLFEARNITLEHVPVNVVETGIKQYEFNYTFQVQIAGDYRLFFILYLDDEPVLPENPMVPYRNYVGTEAFRINDALANDVMSLNLILNVT